MKNSLSAGLFLIFSCLIILLIFTGGYALYMASGLSMTGIELSTGTFFLILLQSLPLFLPLALAVAFFFTILRLKNRPGIRLITFMILFIVSSGLLWIIGTFPGNIIASNEVLKAEASSEYNSKKFMEFNGSMTYIDSINETAFTGVVVETSDLEGNSLTLIRNGRIPSSAIDEDKRDSPSLSMAAFSGRELYPSEFFASFTLAGSRILEWRQSGNYHIFMAAILSFAFYLTSCWGIIQISRWPLFNALAVLLLLSGSGFIYSLFSSDIFEEFLKLLEGKTFGLPPLILAVTGAGILLIFVDLLFIPYGKRIRESENG